MMQCRVLLTLALVACILFITLDAKAIKHKHHGKKKAHVTKHKKAESRQDTPDGGAPEPDAGAGAGTDSGDAGDAAGGAAAGGAAGAGTDSAAPDAEGGDTPDGAPDAAPGAEPGAAPQPAAPQPAGNDLNGNGVPDDLEKPAAPAPQPAPLPAPEEDDGSASGQIPEKSAPPNLYGGHMLPGPTPEPSYIPPEMRYCNEPCPQQCAPACYEWCCFPSIQPPQPPMQLMLVPVKAKSPPPPAVPQPLPYPMNVYGPTGSCSPMPCAAKKHLVTNKMTKSKLFSTFTSTIANPAAGPSTVAFSRDTLERKSEKIPADMSTAIASKNDSSMLNSNNTKDTLRENLVKPAAKISSINTAHQAQSAAIVEDD